MMQRFYKYLCTVAILMAGISITNSAPTPTGSGGTTGSVSPRPTTNVSVVIATGNTFQTVLGAGPRQSLTIENNNATDNCWVFIGAGNATEPTSILLLAGGSYTRYWPYTPSDAIQATCANSSDTLYVDYQ